MLPSQHLQQQKTTKKTKKTKKNPHAFYIPHVFILTLEFSSVLHVLFGILQKLNLQKTASYLTQQHLFL